MDSDIETMIQQVQSETLAQQPQVPDVLASELIKDDRVKDFLIQRIVGTEPVQQQAVQQQEDPISKIEKEIEELNNSMTFEQAALADAQSGNNNQVNMQAYFRNQQLAQQKLFEYNKLRDARERIRDNQVRAKSELPNVISKFGDDYKVLADPQNLAAFEKHLDTLGVTAEQRLNPIITKQLAGTYLYEQSLRRGQLLPPSVAGQQGQGNQQINQQRQQQAQVTPEQLAFANWGGVKAEDFQTIDSFQGGPKANMTLAQKRTMRP